MDEREKAHEAERRVLQARLERVLAEVQELKEWRANMEGRFWMLQAIWAVIVVSLGLGFRYLGK